MLEVRILKRNQETSDIISLELGQVDGSALPKFEPGSHIDVQINENTTRQYSLYNSSVEHQIYKIAVLKDSNSRGGSKCIHESFNEGDIIKISHPRNLFHLKKDSQRTLLFAGGIGITPLLSMAETLQRLNKEFELHYFTRSEESAAFFNQLKYCSFSSSVFFHFDSTSENKDSLLKDILKNPKNNVNTNIYTCGPNGFMDFIFTSAKELGWPTTSLHKEVFKSTAANSLQQDIAFTLNLVKSGITICVPAKQTVLEALEEHGIEIDSSCEQGICGSCLTKVTDGVPDHRDQFLSEDEKSANDQFTPCCSRALSESLSIDL
ncbi:PDR/VanB family oxidoreductase [Cycloclasticus pugetii]|uniref:PDR/VanB family oxidoreductase n=1 Tax=Cycloclasticus pugetii TaxID=34068 RepID=UPI003A910467